VSYVIVNISGSGDPDAPDIQMILAPGLAEKLQITDNDWFTRIVVSRGSCFTDGRASVHKFGH
jgi:hypothetical protein